jgi:hypothetical protein
VRGENDAISAGLQPSEAPLHEVDAAPPWPPGECLRTWCRLGCRKRRT